MQDLGHPNLTVRFKATNELVARGGKEGVEAVLAVMKAHKPDRADQWRRMHGLWVLERCGALDDATLTAATTDDSLGVRVHAQRVLSEREKWNAGERGAGPGRAEGLLRGRAAGGRRSPRPAPLAGKHTAAAGPALRCPGRGHAPACTWSAWPCATSCSRGRLGRAA